MSKKLVAYFSASGITAKVAEDLADAIGADIFEIRPEVPYTKADLNWMDKKSRSTIEMSNPDSRPAIAAKRDNMDEYDTIFVGFIYNQMVLVFRVFLIPVSCKAANELTFFPFYIHAITFRQTRLVTLLTHLITLLQICWNFFL